MVGEMILLFDKNSNYLKSRIERKIKIKPLEIVGPKNKKEGPHPSEQDISTVQTELKQLYDELKQVQNQKASLIKETKEEVKAIREQWETEKQQIIENAREDGYRAGFEMGKQESIEKYNEILLEANSIVKKANYDYQDKIKQAEEDILTLSVYIAKKVLQQELSEHPESFLSLVAGAIQEVKEKPNLSVYLHPEKYSMVIQQKNELHQVIGKQVNLSIYVDHELQPDSCIIEHPSGQIDASVDIQLDEIKARLQELKAESK